MASTPRRLAHDLSSANFRAYTSTDITGVEVGGAVKNVLAIGAGLSDGLGFGANTRIALITRGLVEMTRLGVALGAQRETFMGLAGLGDLVLTCTDDHSRNRRFGLALAQGAEVAGACATSARWSRATTAAQALRRVAAREDVVMPIARGHLRRAVRAAAGRAGGARPDDAADQARVRLSGGSSRYPDPKPFCRQASYTTTATALARLRLRLPERIGIASRRSAGSRPAAPAGRPAVSEPNSSASPGSNRASL